MSNWLLSAGIISVSFCRESSPSFLAHLTGSYGQYPYGFPVCDRQGVKFSTFYGWPTLKSVEQIEALDKDFGRQWYEDFREFLHQYIPGANGKLLSRRRCLYTLTPDKHFIVDRHPQWPNLLIAAGFSGHGFKFTTLIGKILADWIIGKTTLLDMSIFRLSRFSEKKSDDN